MNAIAEIRPKSVLIDMASRYGMEPAAFEATVRATVTPTNTSKEEFAAFLLVAKEYNLNPLTKEIYAFPKRGGGIVPIVAVDGWVSLVNSHPSCDGFEFEFEHDDKNELVSCTCRMYRKDRSRPVTVTEYLAECYRATDPWKMKHRMLRHKAMIQAARYAFGFSGIYDEDEGAKIAEMREINPVDRKPPAPPKPPEAEHKPAPATIDHVADSIDADPEDEPTVEDMAEDQAEVIDDTTFFEQLEEALAVAGDLETLEEVWTEFDPMARFDGKPNGETNQGIAMAIRRLAEKRIGGAS